MRAWRRDGEEIVLSVDFNQNIYTSGFARALQEEDIQLEEQFRELTGQEAPPSHFTGSQPIVGILATPGIKVTSAFIARHFAAGSVGDHRLHVFDFCSASVVGLDTPTVAKVAGHMLQRSVKKVRDNYCRLLIQLTGRHRMYKKINVL